MALVLLAALALFGVTVPSNAEQGYVVVPCAVSEAGRITVRKECGVLPVAHNSGNSVPSAYHGTD
jgi:hypothetical protein